MGTIAYKLMRVRRDGSIGSLFIDRPARYELDTWYEAEPHPTNGFAFRPGFHCTAKPDAPHLLKGKAATERRWYTVEIEDFTEFERPPNQGGLWYLANAMKIIGPTEEST